MGRKSSTPGVEARGGSVRIIFRYNGRKHAETARGIDPTPVGIRRAVRLAAEIRERIRAGTFVLSDYFPESPHAADSDHPTFAKCAERWLLDRKAVLTKGTLQEYENTLDRVFIPELGPLRIRTITYQRLSEVFNKYPWGSMKSRNNALAPVRGIFNMAVKDAAERNIAMADPSLRLECGKVQLEPPDPLDQVEVELVLAQMREKEKEPYLNYFEFAFFSGLRVSELLVVRWDDVDWNAGTIRVQRAWVRRELKGTKTYEARDIELAGRALAALTRQKAHSRLHPSGFIWIDPITGERFADDKPPRLVWNRCLTGAKVRARQARHTRHTFATLALMSGANPMWVARQLGHANTLMLYKHYSKWIEKADQGRERAKLDAMMGTSVGTNGGIKGLGGA